MKKRSPSFRKRWMDSFTGGRASTGRFLTGIRLYGNRMVRGSPPLRVNPDLKINFAGVEFANPVLVASGTFNYGEEMARFYPLSKLGGIVTKSITLKPRPGHPFPRTYETTGGMLNAIGLANPGIEKFLTKKMPFLRTLGTRLVVNIAGSTIDE